MEILWKGTVSAQFRANRSKLCGNCAFPQNFHTSKLGEITVFLAVHGNKSTYGSAEHRQKSYCFENNSATSNNTILIFWVLLQPLTVSRSAQELGVAVSQRRFF